MHSGEVIALVIGNLALFDLVALVGHDYFVDVFVGISKLNRHNFSISCIQNLRLSKDSRSVTS